MKPRRALIFSLLYYPRFVGGAEVAVKEITDRISPGEMEFDMIALNGGGELPTKKIGNITVHRILNSAGRFSKLRYPWAAAAKARQLHKIKPFDLTWSIMASYAGYAGMLFKKHFPNIPFVLTIQEGENFGRRKLFYTLFKRIFRAANKVQVISNYLADWSRKMGATAPITVVPNGVDCDLFAKPIPEKDTNELKGKLDKKKGDVLLITTSRLTPKNAVADIIQSLKYLPNNVRLLILGIGPLEQRLKRMVADSNMTSRVLFLGFVPHAEMPKYLHASDIFIRPSLTEGFGNSFIEAMAAGLPVIATPVGGIVDFLRDGETGLFCEVNNPQSIAQKVQKLIRDHESRDYIVNNAREMVKEKYQWTKVAGEMKKILENA